MHSIVGSIVEHLTAKIQLLGFKPVVHFELEGVFEYAPNTSPIKDFSEINRQLKALDIDGVLVPEYWANQWEYVSLFNGQSPLKEAQNLVNVMKVLPHLVRDRGVNKVVYSPVIWNGDQGRYMAGSGQIFANDTRPVHIPNAIQINISLQDENGNNIIANTHLGEWIQYQLLLTGEANSLLFLPEEDAFKRIALRTEYGLDAELCSPCSLSGGHQGSIALYKERGKHNQLLGVEPLVLGAQQEVMCFEVDWTKTARVEHRLGATSEYYDPHINVIYTLLNVLDAIHAYREGLGLPPEYVERALPGSLHDKKNVAGALTIFERDPWFERSLTQYCDDMDSPHCHNLGLTVKQHVLQRFTPKIKI